MTAGIMISCAAAECADVDPDPETVNGYVPGAAVPAFMFSVVEPPLSSAPPNEPDAPVGSPAKDKLIFSGEPKVTAALTV